VCDVGFFTNMTHSGSDKSLACISCKSQSGLICDREDMKYTDVGVESGFFRIVDHESKLVVAVPCPSGVSGCSSIGNSSSSSANDGFGCNEGYSGLLCSVCSPLYYNSKKIDEPVTECVSCISTSITSRQLSLGLMIVIGLVAVAFMIHLRMRKTANLVTLDSNNPENSSKSKTQVHISVKNADSVLQRLTLSHLQILSILGGFDFRWPAMVQGMFQASSMASTIGSSTTGFSLGGSLQCEIYIQGLPAPLNNLITLFYQLIIMVVAVSVFWCLRFTLCSRGKKENKKTGSGENANTDFTFKQSLGISLVYVLYMMHSNITSGVFQLFSCVSVTSLLKGQRLQGALDVICYSWESHLKVILPYVIIGLVFMVLLPLISWEYLRRYHENNAEAMHAGEGESAGDEKDVMIITGILYDGYR